MPRPARRLLPLLVAALVLVVGAACTDDGDGDDTPATGSGSSGDGAGQTTDNELVAAALDEYKVYVLDQIDETIAATTVFTDAVRAVDARVDGFEGVDDPDFTGWHRIEHLLWEEGDAEAAVPFADRLDDDLQTLKTEVTAMDIPPAALVVGASELIEEVSTGKITGEEDRYSHTDLWDFAANVEGSEAGIELLTPALEEADPELLADIEAGFAELDAQLAEYADGEGGYLDYTELTDDDRDAMAATLAELSENLSQMAGVLGLSS